MDQRITRTFPTRRSDPADVPAEFAELREQPPGRVRLPDGSEHWLLTRHADVREALADPRVSADDSRPGFPQVLPGLKPGDLSFTRMDDPEHGQMRRMVAADFTVRRIAALRSTIEGIVSDLLDEMAAEPGPVDLVQRFALPVPTLVICRLLGVPYQDHRFFQTRGAAMFSANPPEVAGAAYAELADYIDNLLVEREQEPTDDVVGRIGARVQAGELTHEAAVGMTRQLLVAGHETTANALAVSVVLLLQHPDKIAAIRQDPELMRPAVDELLRYVTITQGPMARLVTEPREVRGVRMQPGDGIIISLLSANRDGRQFPSPDELDLTRSAKSHLAFGFGPHQCLGQSLARTELEVALVQLFLRFPTLKLACAVDDLPFRLEAPIYGVNELPVTW